MRPRSLGRWVGRILAVAAVGVGATLGVTTSVGADELESAPADSASEAPAGPESSSVDDYKWE